jgi:hypothetical protein
MKEVTREAAVKEEAKRAANFEAKRAPSRKDHEARHCQKDAEMQAKSAVGLETGRPAVSDRVASLRLAALSTHFPPALSLPPSSSCSTPARSSTSAASALIKRSGQAGDLTRHERTASDRVAPLRLAALSTHFPPALSLSSPLLLLWMMATTLLITSRPLPKKGPKKNLVKKATARGPLQGATDGCTRAIHGASRDPGD